MKVVISAIEQPCLLLKFTHDDPPFLAKNKVNNEFICEIVQKKLILRRREIGAILQAKKIVIFFRSVVILICNQYLTKHVRNILLTQT